MKQKQAENRSEDHPVSATDELVIPGDAKGDRTREFGEFKATNTPLSASDLRKKRGKKWVPRTTSNVEDFAPTPEKPNSAS